ncbi:MAG: KilA-N domain-containing protein [Prolixibacteraceae bacterium]|nr:KilA-N domain-containing protein [Prolixibacteraceae bacterium]MBN2648197.1 KilA-N domain-containing protein [Prolixibacteraceae bacterium]
MAKNKKINVEGTNILVYTENDDEFISLTDIARYRDAERSDYILQNWMRNRSTIEFMGLWELFNNPDFNSIEFDGIKNLSGSNSFALTPKRWIETTRAIGIVSKTGRYGGTFAHRDIAFEFASWLSAEFKFYLIKEFQRLKKEEQKQLGWSAKRELTKLNYHIHTDAIKQNLIPDELTPAQTSIIYASEADVLNMALFGKTAKQWREANPELKGNMRDYANINQLICLANMENLNAVFINENIPQKERLKKLNRIAIQQMKILIEVENRKLLK